MAGGIGGVAGHGGVPADGGIGGAVDDGAVDDGAVKGRSNPASGLVGEPGLAGGATVAARSVAST